MKRNLTFFMIVCFAILFTACHKESEGVYNPGKKISKTYYTAYNSDGTIEQPRHLSETYTWNKDNTLNNIESEWSRQSYTYYSNKRIKTYTYQSKVDGWSYTSEYKYKGNQLSEIKLSDGEIYQFTHKNGKIVTITYGVYNNDKNADKSKVSPLRFCYLKKFAGIFRRILKCNGRRRWERDPIQVLMFTCFQPIH